MIIERKIKINNNNYLLGIKLKYNQNKHLTKMDNSYFDLGDLSIMIAYFEKQKINKNEYDSEISYMNDIIYLYDRFLFIEYKKNISYDKDNKIKEITIIDKDEILEYISNHHISINKWNKDNCICPMIYK